LGAFVYIPPFRLPESTSWKIGPTALGYVMRSPNWRANATASVSAGKSVRSRTAGERKIQRKVDGGSSEATPAQSPIAQSKPLHHQSEFLPETPYLSVLFK
jgi:hypothetical protein